MAKGQLPKAYLRIDPNLDQHPDAEGMLMLICAANRLPRRGRWDTRDQIDRVLGRRRANTFLTPRAPGRRPDIYQQADGTFYLAGWDEWQEGDYTVGERQARLRSRRDSAVTPPLLEALQKPLRPSEASRRQGSKASDRQAPPSGGGAAVDPPSQPPPPAASASGAPPNGLPDHDPDNPLEARLAGRVVELSERGAGSWDDVLAAISSTPAGKHLTHIRGASPAWIEQSLRDADRFEADTFGEEG